MPDDKGQEDEPLFSYVTVGSPDADAPTPQEDEEIITIGAVDIDESPLEEMVAPAADGSTEAVGVRAEGQEAAHTQTAKKDDDEDGLDASMPLAQKLVIAVCVIALIVTIVFLVRFWVVG
jgi:hypothetical protein